MMPWAYDYMDPCMWATSPPLQNAPEFGPEDVAEILNEWDSDGPWDNECGQIVLLKDGDYGYIFTWHDMTFDGGHSYRAKSLEDIIKWALTEFEREKMGYN